MIEIEDNNFIHQIQQILTNQAKIDLNYLHHRYNKDITLSKVFCFDCPDFQKTYKSFIFQKLQPLVNCKRIVYAAIPSIVFSFPNDITRHQISHPLIANSYSAFCPLTTWSLETIISIKKQNTQQPCYSTGKSLFIIDERDYLLIPELKNPTSNTSFGIFFYFMSYTIYKQSNIFKSKYTNHIFRVL